MTIDIDDLDGAPERIPGDFKRDKHKTPYVTHPTKRTQKGEPRWERYSRPSGYHHQIEDGYSLAKWDERNIVLGLATDGNLDIADLLPGDIDDPEWRKRADGIVAEAKRVAKSMLAAERGTLTHEITDGTNWLARAEAGEDLGIPIEVQAALVDAWHAMLAANGLEILATELPVVHDGYRCAGTLDHVARLTKDLSFVLAGEVVTLAAGTVVILDKKSGKMTIDERGGHIMWWQGYAVQVAIYAGSVPYDTTTDQRVAWGYEVDQSYALIAHLPVGEALAGRATCRLVLVDLAKGRAAADLCKQAKAWERDRSVFGLGHEQAEVVVEVAGGVGLSLEPAADDASSRLRPTPATTRPKRGVSAVVGLTFCPGYPDTVNALVVGDPVRLERDPANAHDPNAIRVFAPADGPMIGHLPRDCAALVAPLMDAGETWIGAVHKLRFSPSDPAKPGVDVSCWRDNSQTPEEAEEASCYGPLDALLARADALKAAHPEAPAWLRPRWPLDCPPLRDVTDPEHLAALDVLLGQAEAHFAMPFADHDATLTTPTTISTGRPAPQAWQRPDDGDPVDEATAEAVRRSVRSLPGELQSWVSCRLNEARAAGRDLVVSHQHTARSLEVVRCLTNAALVMADRWGHDEEMLRLVLAAHLGDDGALMPTVTLGEAFCSLRLDEAARLAATLERAYDGSPAVAFDDTGRLVPA